MGRLRITSNELNYKKHDRWLKEQLINEINYEMMTAEIIKKPSSNKRKLGDITSEQVFSWVKRVEVQRAEKVMLQSIQENKDFGMIRNMKSQMKR